MLTAKVCAQAEEDWTAELAKYNVSGKLLAASFVDETYINLFILESTDVEGTLDVIEEDASTTSVQVVERYDTPRDRARVIVVVRGDLGEFAPLQTLLQDGFLPLGQPRFVEGYECFDVLVEGRDELAAVVATLEACSSHVYVDRISSGYSYEIVPSTAEWQAFLSSLTTRQSEVLRVAFERGYFESPRAVTLEGLADEMEVSKATASEHLRKAQKRMLEFLVDYLDIAMQDQE